jgi:hypothetical protein
MKFFSAHLTVPHSALSSCLCIHPSLPAWHAPPVMQALAE